MTKGVVGYIRVSTAEQAKTNYSIPVQTQKITSLCQQRSLSLLETFTDSESGRSSGERKQFQRMLEYCRRNKAKVGYVVVADLSRLARNVLDQSNTVLELQKLGIELVSVDEPSLDESAAGRLLKNILGSMNQFFSDSLSEKTKFRMDAGVKAGRWLWVAPLGYLNDIKTKTVVLDPERAPLVAKAFELLGDGGSSIGDTMRQVAALGLTTRTGRPVPSQTFSRMIRNPFYCGWIEKNGTRVRGNHVPLVSEDLFDSVQARLKGHVPHQQERDDFPLRGFIRCSKCGRSLTAGWVKGKTKRYRRYWCWQKECKTVKVSADHLEHQFANVLHLIQPEARLLADLPRLATHAWAERKDRIAEDSKALVRRLDDQTVLREKAIKEKLLGRLSEDDFKVVRESIERETNQIREQIRALDEEKSSWEDLQEQQQHDVLDFRASWWAATPDRKREIQSSLFPEGLVFDPEFGYFEHQNESLFQLGMDYLGVLKLDGVPDGI